MAVNIEVDEPEIDIRVRTYDGYVEVTGISVPLSVGDAQVAKGDLVDAGPATSALVVGDAQTAKGNAVGADGTSTALVTGDGQTDKGSAVSAGGTSAQTVVGDAETGEGESTQADGVSAPLAVGDVEMEGPWEAPWRPEDRSLSSLDAAFTPYPADPTFYLRFDEPHDLPKRIKDGWQRGTEATYWDGTQLRTAAAHEPRIQVDPVTGERYLLAEPQRTNLLLNSDTLSGQTVTVSGATTYTLSFWGGGDVTLSNAHSKTVSGSGSGTRTTYTFTTSGTTLDVAVSGTVENAQIEQGNFPTSYIPNGNSQTTRAPDDLSDLPFSMQSGAKSVYFRIEQEANGYAPNEGGNIINSEVNLTDTPGTAGGGMLRPSTGILGISADGWIDAVANSTDEDLQGNSTSDVVDGLTIQPDKDPSTDGAIYRIHELVAWEEERSYAERRSLTSERPQPWQELDAPNINTLDTLGGDIDWSADVGIDNPPHFLVDVPRFGVPAKMRSAWKRDTVATYWDENGVLQTAQAGEPRLARSYDGSQWKTQGVLAEPQRTNYESDPRFGDYSDGDSLSPFGGYIATGKTGIDGTNNAVELYGSGGEVGLDKKDVSGQAVGATLGLFVKKNTAPPLKINHRIVNDSGIKINHKVYFDPDGGSFSVGSEGGAEKVEDWGDWWRVIMTINNTNTTSTDEVYPYIRGINGSEGNGVIVDAVQIEIHHAVNTDSNGYADATHATMPILTGGATRSEDKLVMPVWWPQGIVSGGYFEAQQEAGDIYAPGGGNVAEALLRIGSSKAAGVGFGCDHGLADATDGTDYSSGAGADGLVTQAANTNDGAQGGQDVQRLYVLPDRTPSNVSGARHILRRLYLWPQELTEGSGGQLKALFDHDFSV